MRGWMSKKKEKKNRKTIYYIHITVACADIDLCFSSNVVAFNFIQLMAVSIRSFSFFLSFLPPFTLFALHYLYVLADAIDDYDDEFHINAIVAAKIVEAIENECIVLSCGQTEMPHEDVKWFFNGKFLFMLFFS